MQETGYTPSVTSSLFLLSVCFIIQKWIPTFKLHWKKIQNNTLKKTFYLFLRPKYYLSCLLHMAKHAKMYEVGILGFFFKPWTYLQYSPMRPLPGWSLSGSQTVYGAAELTFPFDSPHQQPSSTHCIHTIYTLSKTEGGPLLITHLHNV